MKRLLPRRWTALVRTAPLAVDDAAVLSRIDLGSERIAAFARLISVITIGLVVGILQFVSNGVMDRSVVAVLLTNLFVSLLGLVLTHGQGLGRWLSWLAALLDVAVILGIVIEALRFRSFLPECYNPAHVGSWGVFLALALSAVRGSPRLLLIQTLVFAGGLALADAHQDLLSLPRPAFSDALDACGSGQNAIRITVVLLLGAILVVTTLRSRANLLDAIVASRRAAKLSLYLAPSVASVVADTDAAALRQGRHQNVAVLFADVRGFTSLTETMPPRDIAVFLTEFRRLAREAIEQEGGIIDKFIGDEVMGLFGVPVATSRDAGRAIRAAGALLLAVGAWNVRRAADGLPRVEVGIGIHYGPVFAGVLGDERLEFTVLGNTVNIARRLEELTKSLGHDCLVSTWAVRAARSESSGGWSCRGLPAQTIRGQTEPVGVFALLTEG